MTFGQNPIAGAPVGGLSSASSNKILFRSEAHTGAHTNGTVVVNVPAGVVDGDVLVAVISQFDTTGFIVATWTDPSGWTLIKETTRIDANNINYVSIRTLIRVANTEPASYTWTRTPTGSGNDGDAGAILAYSGVSTTTPQDVVVLDATYMDNTLLLPTNPNPPTNTSVTDDARFVSAVAVEHTVQTAAPANQTGRVLQNSYGVADSTVAAHGAFDPAAFTGADYIWVAQTIVLRPAGPALYTKALAATLALVNRQRLRYFPQGVNVSNNFGGLLLGLYFHDVITGTLNTQPLAALLSFTGAIQNRTGKALPATLFLSGAVTRFIGRPMTATALLSGVVTKQTSRLLAGTLLLVGAALKTPQRLLSGVLSLVGGAAAATVAVDAAADTVPVTGASSTWAHTVSGASRYMLVGVLFDGPAGVPPPVSPTSVTYNGQNLTRIGGIRNGNAQTDLWGMKAPDLGTHNVVVTMGSSVNNLQVGSVSFTGVDQFSPLGALFTATSNSVTVADSEANDMVLDAIGADSALTVDVSQTQQWNRTGGSYAFAGSTKAGAANVTMTWTPDNLSRHAAISVKHAGHGVIKQTRRTLFGTTLPTGAITRAIARPLAATLLFIGATAKMTSRLLTATLLLIGALTAGHLFTKAVAGTLLFIGATTKQTTRVMSATLLLSGAITRFIGRLLSGTLVLAGAVTKNVQRGLTATLLLSGVVLKSTLRTLSGTLLLSGATATLKAFGRLVQGTLFLVGAQTKQTGKALAATLFLVGAVTKSVRRALAATLLLSGAVFNQTRRTLTGTLLLSGAVVRQAGKALTGTLLFIGAQSRFIGKALAATLLLVGAVTKNVRRSLTATLLLSGVVLKSTLRTFAGTLLLTGAIATLKAFGRLLQGTLFLVGAQTKQTTKALSATLLLAGAVTRSVRRSLSATLLLVGTVLNRTSRSLSGTLLFSGVTGTLKAFTKLMAGTLLFVGAQTRQTGKLLGATLPLLGAITRFTKHTETAALLLSGVVNKRTARTLGAAVLALVGSVAAGHIFARLLAGTLLLSGAVTKQTGKALSGTALLTGAITRRTTRVMGALLILAGVLPRFATRLLTGTLILAGATLKQARRLLTGQVSFSGFADGVKSAVKTALFTASLVFSGRTTRRTGKMLTAVLRFGGLLGHARNVLRGFTEYLSYFAGVIRYASRSVGTREAGAVLRGETAYATYFSARTEYLKG